MTRLEFQDSGARDENFADVLKGQMAELSAELKNAMTVRADADKAELRDALDARITEINAKLEALDAEEQKRQAVGGIIPGVEAGSEKGKFSLTRALQGIYQERVLGHSGVWDTTDYGLEGEYLNQAAQQRAIHVTDTDNQGGYLVATELVPGIIEYLREQAIIYQLGARRLDGLTGNLEMPVQDDGMTAYWVGTEKTPTPDAITQSEAEFDIRTASPKTVGALSYISRGMLMQPAESIEGFVRDEIGKVLALAETDVALVGGGTNEPTGILSTTGVGGITDISTAENLTTNAATGDAASAASALAYFREFPQALRAQNAMGLPGARYAWVGEDRTTVGIESQVDADGRSLFLSDDQALADSLLRFPYFTETAPGYTNGSDADCQLLFGDFNQVILCHWGGLELDVTNAHSDHFARGILAVRGFMSMDVVVRQPKAFASASGLSVA